MSRPSSTAPIANRSGFPKNVATSAWASFIFFQADGTWASAATRIEAPSCRWLSDVASNGIVSTAFWAHASPGFAGAERSVQVELVELAVVGKDPAHRA